jgi:phosphonate transport system substrate-binding protein
MMRLILVVLIFCKTMVAQSAETVLHLGFVPGGSRAETEQLASKLSRELSERLSIKIEPVISDSYDQALVLFESGNLDFAFLTPATYVKLKSANKAKVLLKKVWDEPFYYSNLVVRSNSKLKKIKDLVGKKIAFVDKKSASGFLYPMNYLKKNRIELSEGNIIFTGSHSQSVLALESGQVEAAALFSDDEKGSKGAWAKYAKKPDEKIRVIWTSGPIPNDPFVVSVDYFKVNQETSLKVMYALMEISLEGKEEFKGLLGSKPLSPATASHYDEVEQLLLEK